MKTYLITDTHFNHKNIAKYCNRPDNFNELLWKGLEELPKDCTLIHLGDVCLGKENEVHERIAKLPYKKILIKGNHDRKSDKWYIEHGWDNVCERIDGHYFGEFITLSHFPIPGIQNLNIHGHSHDKGKTERINNHKLLAAEYTNYKPVLLEYFIKT